MKTAIVVKGSMSQIATTENMSIAESFIGADTVVCVDVSGSMHINDSRGGQQRYKVACEELAQLQSNLPGKIAVIAFSSTVEFCPGGLPPFLKGGTDLARALQFMRVTDVEGVRFIIISDGEPNDRQAALLEASNYKNRIDVVYVGPEDRPEGLRFLETLAAASGGIAVTADRAKELSAGVMGLLEA